MTFGKFANVVDRAGLIYLKSADHLASMMHRRFARVGPRYVVENLEKELKMRSIFRLSATILGVKWAV